ncbi:hypothetical protein ERD78_14675 [Allopusillimonas soli]|uniref:Uncharacterized protein n=1 Tax=Allopusillimonas soli TaxID=659016 RepID=A0A853FEK8_9BURK|nr:hypothetical protein [Allopusillimonas soli]NYT38128.1 hypothetical protein [Allopusillimonas soli]TEA74005.1 hypothetical protein ERD78_14675 [Allopusillimonas soli]
MSEVLKNWSEFRPSKTLWFWSSVGVAALTMIIGFSAAGWVTGGTATKQAETASEQAVAQLASNICVNRFKAATDAATKLAALKATDAWKRDSFIEDGGWVTFANMKTPVEGAAELCASKLLDTDGSTT